MGHDDPCSGFAPRLSPHRFFFFERTPTSGGECPRHKTPPLHRGKRFSGERVVHTIGRNSRSDGDSSGTTRQGRRRPQPLLRRFHPDKDASEFLSSVSCLYGRPRRSATFIPSRTAALATFPRAYFSATEIALYNAVSSTGVIVIVRATRPPRGQGYDCASNRCLALHMQE